MINKVRIPPKAILYDAFGSPRFTTALSEPNSFTFGIMTDQIKFPMALPTLSLDDSQTVAVCSSICSVVAFSILYIVHSCVANPIRDDWYSDAGRSLRVFFDFDSMPEILFENVPGESFLRWHKRQFLYNTLHSFVLLMLITEKHIRFDSCSAFVGAFLTTIFGFKSTLSPLQSDSLFSC